jgi:S1-C subfamily serine protease
MNGTTVDNIVVGGPAYNSKQLARGDVILSIDGNEVRNDNVLQEMKGNDVPGASVEIRVVKGGLNVTQPIPICF